MTLEDVKAYLRIDDDFDDAVISDIMAAAEAEIRAAVGTYDDTDSRMQMLYKATVQDMYDHRELMQGDNARRKMGHVFQSLLMQLQLDYGDVEEDNG